jgi:hypothetical protein
MKTLTRIDSHLRLEKHSIGIPFRGNVSCTDWGFRRRAGVSARALLWCYLLLLARPLTIAAAPPAITGGTQSDQLSLPQGIGWEAWHVVRDQHAQLGTVRVLVPKGQAGAAAKVRVVIMQAPKPTIDSPQAVLDNVVQTAKQQCQKASAHVIRKNDADLIYELRGFGCAGQTGERYLMQRIAFIKDWELQVTYAVMSSTDDLPPSEKTQAIKLLSSVTIVPGSSSAGSTGWFLITPPKANSHYDISAPLSKWKVEEGAGSLEKCKQLQTFLSSLVLKQGTPTDVEEVKNARCISMADPGFDGN